MEQAVRHLLERIPLNPHEVRTALRQLSVEHSREFYRAAAGVLAEMPAERGPGRFLAVQLLKDKQLWDVVSDADLMEPEPMANLLRQLVKTDPALDDRLITDTLAAAVGRPDPARERRVGHALEVLTELSGARMLPWLMRLLRHGSPHIRSKAALLIGRTNRNAAWARLLLLEKDPRVRANAVQALWKADTPGCEELFRKAATDRDNRVAGNGVLGLYHAGDPRSLEILREMADSASEDFRGTAAWAMGNTGDPRFLEPLAEMIRDEAATVRRNALRARARILRLTQELKAKDGLRCRLLKAEAAGNGLRQVRVSVNARSGAALMATGFAIEEAGEPVWEYSVTAPAEADHAAVAFVMPRRSEGAGEAIRRELERKPRLDSWAIQRFETESANTAEAIAGAEFFSEPREIEAELRRMLPRSHCAGDPLVAVERARESLAREAGSRNIVILVDQDDLETPGKAGDAAGAAARQAGIRIHGLRVDGAVAGWLDRAASATGGVAEICERADLTEALGRVLGAAGPVYEISYVVPGPGDGKPVRVRALSAEGLSEDKGTLSTLIPLAESSFDLD